MACIIQSDEIRITFLEVIKSIPGMFCYKLKIEALANTKFKIANFTSPHGVIFKPSGEFLKDTYIDKYKLLKDTKIKKDIEIEGYIAFYKNEIATLSPEVFYNDSGHRIRRGKKHGTA
jgi:hypothetical protein